MKGRERGKEKRKTNLSPLDDPLGHEFHPRLCLPNLALLAKMTLRLLEQLNLPSAQSHQTSTQENRGQRRVHTVNLAGGKDDEK